MSQARCDFKCVTLIASTSNQLGSHRRFSDDDSLVDELMRVKKEAGAWRYHPEFPENKAATRNFFVVFQFQLQVVILQA